MFEAEPESWFDCILRYGLYAGAIFQIACIAAIVLLPPRKDGSELEHAELQGGASTSAGGPAVKKNKTGSPQKRPKEKKKKK
jgi:hypothetical protein